MAFKFIAAVAFIAVASAGFIPTYEVYHTGGAVAHLDAPATVVKTVPHAAHYVAQPLLTQAAEEYDAHPQYKYGYDVQDTVSGDSKSQVEERDGDVVRGEYSLTDADGFKRTVHYTADDVNGFNAVVHREPLVKTVAAVKAVATPVHYAAAAPAVLNTDIHDAAHGYVASTQLKSLAPAAHYAVPDVAHYGAPTLVKSVAPVYATYSQPAALVRTAPVAHYNAAPAYASYSAPAAYVTHH